MFGAQRAGIHLDQFIRAAEKAGRSDVFVLRGNQVVLMNKSTYLDSQNRELNRRTWEAFERALKNVLSPKRFDCAVARYNINFERSKNEGLPLTRRYIEAAGIAASCVYTFQLREESGRWGKHDLQRMSVSRLQDLYMASSRFGYLGKDVPDPEDISGGPHEEIEYFHQSYQTMDARRCKFFEGVENLHTEDPNFGKHHAYLSRLTMGIISLLETQQEDRGIGLVVPAPGAKRGEIDYYNVWEIACYGGLTAVVLVPISNESTLSPVICFRCTKQSFGQADSIASMLNDTEPMIGKTGYEKSKHRLDEVVEHLREGGWKKPIVANYSLGGSHATYFMADHWREVAECVCFNPVGNKEVADKIAREINALPPNVTPPPIYHYWNKGDHAPGVGDKHLGYGVTHEKAIVQLAIFDIDDYPMPDEENIMYPPEMMKSLNIHAVRPLDSKKRYKYRIWRGKECSRMLDNKKRNSAIEVKREKWGVNFFHTVVSTTYQILDFIFRLFGIEYFKKNLG